MSQFYVYIITNFNTTTLYTGFTDDLYRRVQEHKLKLYKHSFSSKYNLDRLLYFEEFTDKEDALAQEKRIKKYKREWKDNLINAQNPNWIDLSKDFEAPE